MEKLTLRLTVFTIAVLSIALCNLNAQTMQQSDANKDDLVQLSKLNKQFIKNFVNQDATAHDKIIHEDFVCIQGSGVIVGREEYLKGWATGYTDSGYKSFDYKDEVIRIFGNVALVRSRTVYTKSLDGAIVHGNSLYTDTYLKENGEWKCIQAQITPIK